MYLFQPKKATAYVTAFIVFTFHYVSISTLYCLATHKFYLYLHSTMYLFQLNTAKPAPKVKTFTFHYVSISTRISFRNTKCTILFTFHYVSISTTCVFHSFCLQPVHLHSTMYLFQQVN